MLDVIKIIFQHVSLQVVPCGAMAEQWASNTGVESSSFARGDNMNSNV